jgi:hypothetical protein
VFFLRHPKWVIGGPRETRGRAAQSECEYTVGMRRGEEGGEARALRVAEEHRSLGCGRVQDGSQVIGPHVEVRCSDYSVGHTGAAFVEQHHPGEGAEPIQETEGPRALGFDLEVPREPRDVDEVDGSVTAHLIGDVDAVGSLRVAGLGKVHARIIPGRGSRRKLGAHWGVEATPTSLHVSGLAAPSSPPGLRLNGWLAVPLDLPLADPGVDLKYARCLKRFPPAR